MSAEGILSMLRQIVADAVSESCGQSPEMSKREKKSAKIAGIGLAREWLMAGENPVPPGERLLADQDLIAGCGFGFCLGALGLDFGAEMKRIGRKWAEADEVIIKMLELEYAKYRKRPPGAPVIGNELPLEVRETSASERTAVLDAIAFTSGVIERSRKYYG
jgi:hypothetical protein